MDLEGLLRGGCRARKPRHKRAFSAHQVSVGIASLEFETLQHGRNRQRKAANRLVADVIRSQAEHDFFSNMTTGSLRSGSIQNEPERRSRVRRLLKRKA